MDEYEQLRRLLLSEEQEALRGIAERLDDRGRRIKELADALPAAVKWDRAEGGRLTESLEPIVADSIKSSIERNPEPVVEALFPIIGQLVRRAIAESLRGLVQSLNQTMEQSLSWQGFKWRLEAIRTGRSFAEVVMAHSVVYKVQEVFLVHRETGISLIQASADPASAMDSDMVAGMLSAIEDFGRDSFQVDAQTVRGFEYEDPKESSESLNVWIAPGKHAYLAGAIKGLPAPELRGVFQDAVDSSHARMGKELGAFDGDTAPFEALRPELEACLQARYKKASKEGRNVWGWSVVGAGTAAVLVAAFFLGREVLRWRNFVRALEASPGIAVTSSEKNWIADSRISGVRDPLAQDPRELALAAHVDPEKIVFAWDEFIALDPASVGRRVAVQFGVPDGAQIQLEGGTLHVSGSVPYEWLARLRTDAVRIPGVTALVEAEDIAVAFAPEFVLERFRERFPPPPGVELGVDSGVLTVTGEAPEAWAKSISGVASAVAGVTALDVANLSLTYDPGVLLQRFTDRIGLPETVEAVVGSDARLVLTGESSHNWAVRAREAAAEIPGIAGVETAALTDVDQRAFVGAKSIIESAHIYFLENRSDFATEGFAGLSRLPDEIRRGSEAALRLGSTLQLEIRGFADPVGAGPDNETLSLERAEKVQEFLLSCGLDGGIMRTVGLGEPEQAIPDNPEAPPEPELSDRRVSFRVLSSLSPRTP